MKKITIRLDDEIYHMAREFSRRKGVSINALVQGMILAENGTYDGSDELGERVQKLEVMLRETTETANYAKAHSEEVIQSLVLRKNPDANSTWERGLQEALERQKREVMLGGN
jgi:hypothetical protein